jgi:hypothetical protein
MLRMLGVDYQYSRQLPQRATGIDLGTALSVEMRVLRQLEPCWRDQGMRVTINRQVRAKE